LSIETIYPLSEASQQWLEAMISMANKDTVHHIVWDDNKEGILIDHCAWMPNGFQAHIVASINPNVGDWAAYLGAGHLHYAKAYGTKIEESTARTVFNTPLDMPYRP